MQGQLSKQCWTLSFYSTPLFYASQEALCLLQMGELLSLNGKVHTFTLLTLTFPSCTELDVK